jgi:hypothetical protein
MKSRFLFSHQLKPVGWLLAVPGLVLGYLAMYRDYEIPGFGFSVRPRSPFFHGSLYQGLTNTLALTLVIVGLFMVAFSKEKKEDELTARMRHNALYWAVLVNYLACLLWLIVNLVIAVFNLNTDGLGSLNDMATLCTYNLFTPLVIFIARYYYLRYSKNGQYKVDKLFYLPAKPYKLIGQLISVPLLLIILFSFTASWFFKGDIDPKEWVEDLFLLLPTTLLIWGYSRQKNEDEFISMLRLESMQVAVYVNYAILLLANFFFYFTDFLLVMFLNLGTIALFFVIRFNYILWKYNRQNGKGELAI